MAIYRVAAHSSFKKVILIRPLLLAFAGGSIEIRIKKIMAWEKLTLNDLKSALNATELISYSTTDTDIDVPARAEEILADTVQRVRDDIASYHLNRLSIDPFLIPEGYHSKALAIARYELLSSLPFCEVTKSRELLWEKAERFFDSVAAGKRRPEEPADARLNTAAPDKPRPGAQVVNSRPDITGRKNLGGL